MWNKEYIAKKLGFGYVGEVLRLAMPCFLEQLLLVVVNVVSSMIVGQLGKAELSASAMSNGLINWLQCAYTGLASGATVVIARMWGNGDKKGIKEASFQAFKLNTIVSVVVLLFSVIFKSQIIGFLYGSAQKDVLECMNIYYMYSMFGLPFTAISCTVGANLRGIGDNKTPLYSTAVLNVVNLILSIILIFGVKSLKIPKMGIAGAGIAITTARFACAVFIIMYVFTRKKEILPEKYTYGFNKKIIKRIMNIGIPSTLEALVFQGGFVILAILIIRFGTTFQAGYQIGSNLNNILGAPSLAMGVAMTALISKTLGEGDTYKAKYLVRAANIIIYTAFIAISICMYFAAPLFVNLYTHDAGVLSNGIFFARMFALMAIPIGIMQSMSGVLRGAGDAKYVAITNVIGLWVMRVFGILIISEITNNGYLAIIIGCGADFIWRAAGYTIRVYKGKWMQIKV